MFSADHEAPFQGVAQPDGRLRAWMVGDLGSSPGSELMHVTMVKSFNFSLWPPHLK